MNNYDTAIVAAADKKYSEFEKTIAAATEDKIKNHLTGFMDYLDRQTFKPKD